MGWEERRKRLDEVRSVWPVAEDISLESATLDGLQAEWSIAASDATRVLLFFHGGGYCSGSILSHRGLVTEAGRALASWRWLPSQNIAANHIAIGGDSAGGGLTG